MSERKNRPPRPQSGNVVSIHISKDSDVAMLRRAAKVLGLKYTAFVRQAALERAERVLSGAKRKKAA